LIGTAFFKDTYNNRVSLLLFHLAFSCIILMRHCIALVDRNEYDTRASILSKYESYHHLRIAFCVGTTNFRRSTKAQIDNRVQTNPVNNVKNRILLTIPYLVVHLQPPVYSTTGSLLLEYHSTLVPYAQHL
jgi:hypothetical protein